MRALVRAMITKNGGTKRVIKVRANLPGEELSDRHYSAVEKSLKNRFQNATVYIIDITPEDE